jgi:hypothetical protein
MLTQKHGGEDGILIMDKELKAEFRLQKKHHECTRRSLYHGKQQQ